MNTIDKKGKLPKEKRQWVFSSMTLRSRLKTPVSILSAKKKAQIQARLTL